MTEIDNEIEFSASDYLANIKAMQENTVSKEEYARLVKENKQLAKALANGDFGTNEEIKKQTISVEEARNKLFTGRKKTDLQFFSEVLDLRDAVLNEGGRDPLLHTDKNYIPTEQDKADAERIAEGIRESIEYADGDPALFRQEMQRRGCKPVK